VFIAPVAGIEPATRYHSGANQGQAGSHVWLPVRGRAGGRLLEPARPSGGWFSLWFLPQVQLQVSAAGGESGGEDDDGVEGE